MTRQNYYKHRRHRQRRLVDESLVLELVRRERSQQTQLGGRKLWKMLSGELDSAGVEMGRDRMFELLRRHGLLIERPQRGCQTTDSRHGLEVYKNLAADLALSGPNQLWVSDITYIRTEQGFMYLSLVMDAWSRAIVGWDCSDTLELEGALAALSMAFGQLPEGMVVMHHSDRGSQYCSGDYIKLLKKKDALISMTEVNHCYENAKAERLNGTLKREYGLGGTFTRKSDVRSMVREAVVLYNVRRPHAALGYRTPLAVHQAA